MKYVIDLDAFVECLDCLDSMRINGTLCVELPLLKEFINRFPKDKVKEEYTEYKLEEQPK
jgi:hypothetical protein